MLRLFHQKTKKLAVVGWCCASISLVLSTSCSTIYNAAVEKKPLSFTSRPPHATITIKGYEPCETPCEIKVDPVKPVRIKAQIDGYDDKIKWADTRVSFPVFANILLGIPGIMVGLVVDWATDSLVTWSETRFHFNLARTDADSDDDDQEEEGDVSDGDKTNGQDKLPSNAVASPSVKAAPSPATPSLKASGTLAPSPSIDVPDSFVKRVREQIPQSEMDHSIDQYYGKVNESRRKSIDSRLLKQLHNMKNKGEDLDLDEAIRRDKFSENDALRRKK